MALQEYRRKRDFSKTREPTARVAKKDQHRFVIQKHAATRLHYDLRLEMNGVLKSWAVPKGVPFAKGEKRLAVQVEDHPVDYIHFEGTIPKGQYGGGTVMVWDYGSYEADTAAPSKDLASGKLHFALHGKKLKGAWYLVRLRDGEQWLLIKAGEDLRPVSKKAEDSSALSGKTMKQIAGGNQVWESKERGVRDASAAGDQRPDRSRNVSRKLKRPEGRAPKPGASSAAAKVRLAFIPPMTAKLLEAPPPGEWLYEIKFDGYRALALKSGDAVQLLSRNENDLSDKFPEIVESVAELKADAAVLDGEIVALDQDGRSSFQLLQARELGQERPPTYYYAFDLLHLDGRDWKARPVEERKAALGALLKKAPGVVRFSASLGSDAGKLLAEVRKMGLEGLIGKQAGSHYEPGRRSGRWIKLKLTREQEFVIGGYTDPEGSRAHFGALLVGFFERDKFRFAGKVGTGFNDALLRKLFERFQPLARASCPFVNLPEQRAGRYGAGVTRAEMKRCHWIEPKLVGQVRFSEWTRDGKLRQPVFLGLREDKDARDVVREQAK